MTYSYYLNSKQWDCALASSDLILTSEQSSPFQQGLPTSSQKDGMKMPSHSPQSTGSGSSLDAKSQLISWEELLGRQ